MDPNAALKELRELAKALADHPETVDSFDVTRMAELFEALDGWISKGGFLPAAWTPKESPNA